MNSTIRDVAASDLDAVLELNEANVPEVGSISAEQMSWFMEHAPYFRVVDVDDRIGALLVGLRPGLDYGSPNYRWFAERYDDFGYIDRVAVAEHARRLGLASRLYSDFESTLPESVGVMTCEVNLRPPILRGHVNEWLEFHALYPGDTRIIYQNINASHFRHRRADCVVISDIEGRLTGGIAELLQLHAGVPGTLGEQVIDDDMRALPGQCLRDANAYTPAGTGYQCFLTLQFEHRLGFL